MMFYLKSRGRDLSIAEQVHEKLAIEIAYADRFGHVLSYKFFHGLPSFLDRGVARYDIFAIVSKAWGVAI